MKEQLISFETAELAKEKGLDIKVCKCGGFPECICDNLNPTQSLLQKWLREVHDVNLLVDTAGIKGKYVAFINSYGWIYGYINEQKIFDSYEDALEAALVVGLNLIKTNDK